MGSPILKSVFPKLFSLLTYLTETVKSEPPWGRSYRTRWGSYLGWLTGTSKIILPLDFFVPQSAT